MGFRLMVMNRRPTLILCFWALFAGCSLKGGSLTEYQVPPAVLSAFRLDYPTATEAEYREFTKRDIKVYAVEFDLGGLRHEVNYTLQGKPISFEKKEESAESSEAPAEEAPEGENETAPTHPDESQTH